MDMVVAIKSRIGQLNSVKFEIVEHAVVRGFSHVAL
jgi:hypothetical protein